MNFKEWLLSEEIFPNKTATVYHRTKSIKDVSSILTSDYKVGKGCYYGCGLYTTFAIESQFTNYMKTYGKAVVKFKVTDLDKYLIFQLSVAKQIHGKDYKISSQLKKLGLLNKVDQSNLKEYDERQEKEKYSSTLAKEFYDKNYLILNSVKGIIYYGGSDGYCLLKYPTVQDGTITMLAYAVAEPDDMKKMEELKSDIGWIKSVGTLGTSIKNVYKSPIKNKERFAFGDYSYIVDQLLNSKNLEKIAKELRSYINKLSDENFSNLLKKAANKDQMAEVIINYKTELSDDNVYDLIRYASDKDNIAELIIKKKPDISDNNVEYLLDSATENKKDAIAYLIIEKKPELSDRNIRDLISYAINKDAVAELIINNKPELLSSHNVQTILARIDKKDKDKIAELIINKLPEIDIKYNVHNLIYFTINKYKIAELIIKKKPELSDDNVSGLLQYVTDKDDRDKIVELIIENFPELSDNNVKSLIIYATDKYKIAELIIKYKTELSDDNVSGLLQSLLTNFHYETDKDKKIAELIIEKKPELSDNNVKSLIIYARDKYKIAELIIEKKPKLSSDNVYYLLRFATDKDKMAERLQKETDNISKLSDGNVSGLVISVNDRRKMAQIINKYHTKKTPEIQEILYKYLNQTQAAK